MKIVAAVARPREPFALAECELAEPGPRELRVKVEACGLCRTDLSAKDHDYGTPLPAVLGHEGVGRVEALGDEVDGFAIGQRVLMSFGACGRCGECRQRMPAYCARAMDFNVFGRRPDGTGPITLEGQAITGHFFGQSSFASHAVVSTTNLVPLADDLPPTLMCGLACGVQTGVGAALNVLRVEPRDVLVVAGCGTVGLSAVMGAVIAGCASIIAIDRSDARLEVARSLGATRVINNRGLDRDALKRQLRQLGPTRAVDSTGAPEVIEAVFAALRRRGVLALAGLSRARTRISIDANRLMSSGRVIRGTVEGDADPRVFIPQMIAWYRRGQLPLEALVTSYPFVQINRAAEALDRGRAIKPVLFMD